MTNFVDDEDEEEPLVPANRKSHELTVEVLKLLTASLAFAASVIALVSKYPWLSKPWILDGIIVLGLLVLGWFAKPRFAHWLHKIKRRKREEQFIATNDARLREFVEQLAEFLSDNNTRSLRYIVRSACSQNAAEVEKILAGEDYNAFLRNLEPWAKGIAGYLQSIGVTDTPTQWRLAPVTYFDKPKSFKKSQLVTK
jgi:hypothetical protein